ncbi:MAG: MlaC/ttg2D family ABC transporter substrate-binding protein [Candidatus Binataceae bacterium]
MPGAKDMPDEENNRPISRNNAKLGAAIILGTAIAFCLMLAAGAHNSLADEPPSEPMQIVQTTVDHVVGLLKDKSLTAAERRRQLIALVEGHFDFAEMARSSLGYHWKALSRKQRRRFVTVFIGFIEDAYIGKIESYSGQPIQFAKAIQLSPRKVEVDTNILQAEGSPIAVNYIMSRENHSWKVHDVTVDSVSILENYRNQFNRVIRKRGLSALMVEMEQKQKELQRSL